MRRRVLRYRITRFLPGLIIFIFAVSCVIAFFVSKIATISLLQLVLMYFEFFLASQLAIFMRWIEKFEWEITTARLIANTTVTYLIFALGYAFGTANGEEPNIGEGLLLFSLPFLLVLVFEVLGNRPPDPTS